MGPSYRNHLVESLDCSNGNFIQLLNMMTAARPKAKRQREPVPSLNGAESSKDQLLCRLELQQTVYAKTIERLERNSEEVDALRTGFSLLYDRSPVGYMTINARGHIYNVNGTVLNLLQYNRE